MPTVTTIYYNPQGSVGNICRWYGTAFSLVLSKFEFWLYMGCHAVAITVAIVAFGDELNPADFKWEAALALQVLMSFFVSFYNDMCYSRYLELYPACNELMDAIVNFVEEVNISLPHKELRRHHVACCKYLLAAMYEFFMIVTSGKLNQEGWKEMEYKGLLSKHEHEMLKVYPGGRCTLVLTAWVALIVRDAIMHDCCWRGRRQQTVHIYNRLNRHLVRINQASNRIGHIMAMPVPFVYYHLMNVIIMFNIVLLATVPAMYKSYMTLVPFAFALLIYMGLREVSCAIADPFGTDSLDFPIAQFINHTFDRTVCIMESFHCERDVRKRIVDSIPYTEDFTDENLRHTARSECIYEHPDKERKHESAGYRPGGFIWNNRTAINDMPLQPPVHHRLRCAMLAMDNPLRRNKKAEEEEKRMRPTQEANERKLRETERDIDHLHTEIKQLEEDRNELEHIRRKLQIEALGGGYDEPGKSDSVIPALQKLKSRNMSKYFRSPSQVEADGRK